MKSAALAALLTAAALTALPALAQTADGPPNNAVTLTRMFLDLPAGTPWLQVKSSLFCINPKITTYNGGRSVQNTQIFQDPFRAEMQKAGLKAQMPGGDDIFNPNANPSDLELAGIITNQRVNACIPNVTQSQTSHGDATLTIEWQLYSRLRKQVLVKVTTTGAYTIAEDTQGALAKLVTGAFTANVEKLARDAEFRKAALAAQPVAGQTLTPDGQSRIALDGNLKAPTRPIPEAVGDVLVISVGGSSGSGVLVSDDGYVITDAHVVGEAKTVKLRWSDGIETVGEVIRTSRQRDVALVKTDPRGRVPLPLKRGTVAQGQQVFAIGAPLGQKFQGSVSKGVISANRVIDGMSFIQSDVSVAPGSSGGPLLDDSGHVIGLTEMGYTVNGAIAGLNMFIPAGDIMDFLALEIR